MFVDRDLNAGVNIGRAFDAADRGEPPPHHLRAAAADETRGERPPRPPDFHLAAAAPDAWRAAGAAGHGSREHVARARARAAAARAAERAGDYVCTTTNKGVQRPASASSARTQPVRHGLFLRGEPYAAAPGKL
jgi:hypothetical protein